MAWKLILNSPHLSTVSGQMRMLICPTAHIIPFSLNASRNSSILLKNANIYAGCVLPQITYGRSAHWATDEKSTRIFYSSKSTVTSNTFPKDKSTQIKVKKVGLLKWTQSKVRGDDI